MNGVNSAGPYFPFHRDETYPRTLCVNFKRLEYRTLQRYCKLHDINVRPDCTQPELAVAAARHFQEAPAVDEEGVMTSFLKKVVDPERPFHLSIDLAAASTASSTLGKSSIASGRGVDRVGGMVGSDGGAMGGDMDRDSCSNNEDEGNHNYDFDDDDCEDGDYDDVGQQHPRQHPRQHLRHQQQHEGTYHRGMDRDGREYRYGHRGGSGGRVPGRGGNVGFDEKSRMEGYGGRGMGGGGGDGGSYEEDMEYGRQPHQHHHRRPSWEGDGHQDVIPKGGGGRRPGGSRGRYRVSAPVHGGSSAMAGRDGGMNGNGSRNGGGISGGGGEDGRSRKQKSGTGGDRVGGGGDVMVKPPSTKRKKGGGGWRAKNGEQVAVRDDREEPGAWILARVIKYVTETHHYELKDDDDKEGGMDVLTAPRQLVIRLEDSTKGVQRGDRVLAVFPDTTSFYVGVVHRVPKSAVGSERRIEVKFKDDADDNGRTPARPLPARYVVPLPEGYEEEESKPEEVEGATGAGAHDGGGVAESGGVGRGGRGEEEADDPMGTEEEDGEGPPYADMIRTALLKLPGRQGSLLSVCNYIEEHFHDRLNWKSESSLRRTPAWKSSVRRILAHHPSFCHAGTPERNIYTLAE